MFLWDTVWDRAISAKFWAQMVFIESCQTLKEIVLPLYLVAILNFCVKPKICLSVRDIDFSRILGPKGICRVIDIFQKAISGAIFEFLRKMQQGVYIGSSLRRQADFGRILGQEGVCWNISTFFKNIILMPFLVAILNFCRKHKNVFISETVENRAISAILFTQWV